MKGRREEGKGEACGWQEEEEANVECVYIKRRDALKEGGRREGRRMEESEGG